MFTSTQQRDQPFVPNVSSTGVVCGYLENRIRSKILGARESSIEQYLEQKQRLASF